MSGTTNPLIATSVAAKDSESARRLTKTFLERKEEFIAGLSTLDFYIQILVIGIGVSLAVLMGILLVRSLVRRIETRPPKRIDAVFLTKPLELVVPILIFFYLLMLKPIADEFSREDDWMRAALRLSFGWIIAKFVLLVVQTRAVAYFLASIIMLLTVLRATGFVEPIIAYLNAMNIGIGQIKISLLNLFQGIVILVLVFWIAGLLSRTLESYLRRSSSLSYTARELTVKFFKIFVYFIALTLTLSTMGVDLTAFAVFSGALGVGIGLGLQKITANFVSGITLLLEKSIRINDIIDVSGMTGTVRELNIRYTLIETVDGREILIPNEELVSTKVTNWTHTNTSARIDITAHVKYDSDPHRVREIMLQAAKEHPSCLQNPPPNCWLRNFGENAMQFLLVFWIADVNDGKNGPQSDVMMNILSKFKDAGIGIPNPAAQNQSQNLPQDDVSG